MNQETENGQAAPNWEHWENAVKPRGGALAGLIAQSGAEPELCFGCRKCTNGCPLAAEMDLRPWQVIRHVLDGNLEALAGSHTIWLCASCQTCLTRCPNGIDLPRLMDGLKTVALAKDAVAEKRIAAFHRCFLDEVKKRGRVYETGFMARYILGNLSLWGEEAARQHRLGLKMFKRGRLKLLPGGTKNRAWLKEIFGGEA